MPCFKGIAVSIHANGAPLPEYGVQKQSRVSRINTYIPVPQPQINPETNKPEPAKFAISITLLTPNLAIPYSAPKPTPQNPFPKPQLVGPMPSSTGERGKYHGVVMPYIPMTNSENETIAAYIYFDGRAKEEVATLLRPGEETWVNSRWVQVPESEGGGLAEREFLFREVGLERWLNGLDLKGHDAAEKLERRRQKFEKRRRRAQARAEAAAAAGGMDVESSSKPRSTLRYAADETSPLEAVPDEDSISSSSDDDEPPEAAGQIKVAMFRVIASGEIKKGEYSPQFDAHDDSDDEAAPANGIDADVEHTTSFAKPKTLDPKTISTQTVTGIDGPDKPYAVFTFFYRGERQLQKMGVMAPPKSAATSPALKRRSGQLDFSNLGPLKTTGTVGFSAFRDKSAQRKKRRSNGIPGSTTMDADSDDDDDDDDRPGADLLIKMEDVDSKDDKSQPTGPEDSKFTGELADGVNRIRLKRAHSAEPDSERKSPASTPPETTPTSGLAPLGGPAGLFGKSLADTDTSNVIGSPLKKARPSLGAETSLGGDFGASGSGTATPAAGGSQSAANFPSALGDVLAKAQAAQASQGQDRPAPAGTGAGLGAPAPIQPSVMEEEEEL